MTRYSRQALEFGRIVAGPDGNLWFTNYSNNSIGRINVANLP